MNRTPSRPVRIIQLAGKVQMILLDRFEATAEGFAPEPLPPVVNPRAWRPTSWQSVLKLDKEINACLAAK